MELGMALFLGFVLWLAADSITASITTQLLLLVGYGLLSASWLVYRTRRVLLRWKVRQWDKQKNQQNKPESDQTTHSDGR
jgi:ABC-type nickel/cobalt efflux system permease component RcnA